MREKKVKKRDMKLSDYNISREKYNELKYFCLQYWQKKQMISARYGMQAKGQQPMRDDKISSDIEMIEQTAKEADPEIHKWILKNVTSGVPYEYMDVPLSRTKFYDTRRYFFYLLAQKK